MELPEPYKSAFQNIMDTFTGADGCLRFVMLRTFLLECAVKTNNGDDDAKKIMDIILPFSKMIDLAVDIGRAATKNAPKRIRKS